jgi:hypothetical protein
MTDMDAGDFPSGWAKLEIERIAVAMSVEASGIKNEVMAAISHVLTKHGLDDGLDEIPPLERVLWVLACKKLIAKALGAMERQVPERQSLASERTCDSLRSGHRFTWRYDRQKRRLSVSGTDLQRDLAAIQEMVVEGNISRDLIAVVHQAGGKRATVLRGHQLDRWLKEPTGMDT